MTKFLLFFVSIGVLNIYASINLNWTIATEKIEGGGLVGFDGKVAWIIGSTTGNNKILYFNGTSGWISNYILRAGVYGQSYTQLNSYIYYVDQSYPYGLTSIDMNTYTSTQRPNEYDFPENLYYSSVSLSVKGQCITATNDYIYIIGGACSYSGFFECERASRTFIYDILNGMFYYGANLVLWRYAFGCNIFNNNIYIIGGYGDATHSSIEYININNVQLQNEYYTILNDIILTPPRMELRSIIINNYGILIVGGLTRESNTRLNNVDILILNDNSNIRIESLNTLNIPRYASILFKINNIIYIVGGYYEDSIEYTLPIPEFTSLPTRNTISPTKNPTLKPSNNNNNNNNDNNSNNNKKNNSDKKGKIIGITVACIVAGIIILIIAFIFVYKLGYKAGKVDTGGHYVNMDDIKE